MLVSGLFTNAFADQHFSSVIAFGDSLSDNGNYYRLVDRLTPLVPQDGSPPLPYFFGRFSNGPVAVELLAEQLGLPLDDHAVGGALSGAGNEDPRFPQSGLRSQVQAMVDQRGVLDGKALYVIWCGANDLLALLKGQTSVPPNTVITNAVGNISTSIGLLYARGARHFLLPNLPDLGLTPVARNNQASALASQLSGAFNAGYQLALANVSHQLPRAHIYAVDVTKVEQAVVSNPAASGLSNITEACISDPRYECILSSFNARPTTYLYWDDVHPTAEGHALLAAHFLSAVSSEEP
jgi:phospholipase/lecithinase/hemolysin